MLCSHANLETRICSVSDWCLDTSLIRRFYIVCSAVTFVVCLNKAHDKDSSCRVFYFVHTAKMFQNNWILTLQIFWYKNTVHFAPLLNFGNFLDIFAIFRHLMSVIKFLMIVLEVFWWVEYNVYKIDRHNSESNVSMCAWNRSKFWRFCSQTMTKNISSNHLTILLKPKNS